MPTPSPARMSLRRLVALLAALLLPLAAVLVAAPAQAAMAAVSGSVSDSLGDPLDGVTVEVLLGTSSTVVGTLETVNGEYAFGMPGGDVRLRFSKAGYTTAYYGGGTGVVVSADADGVVTVGGEVVADGVLDDVTMIPSTTHVLGGTVVDAGGGAPLSGIHVGIYTSLDDTTPVTTTTSGPTGAFTATLPDGLYQLHLEDPAGHYQPRWLGDVTPLVLDRADLGVGQVALTAVAADSEFPIAGRVVDANGDPVNAVTVTVTGVAGSTDSGSATTAGTDDAAGGYSVSVLPGTYRVTFARTGFVTRSYGECPPATVTVAATGALSVSPAEDLTGNRLGDVTLLSNPFAVVGTVAAAGGGALSGITVSAYASDDEPGDAVDTTTTDGSGGYTLDLPVGTYTVNAVDDVADATTYDSAWLGGATHSVVRVAQDGSLTVDDVAKATLPAIAMSPSSADTPHTVTGTVVDVNGDPVAGRTVTAVPTGVTPADHRSTGTTGADGVYHLALKSGTYRVDVAGGTDFADASYTAGGEVAATVTVALNGAITPAADLGALELLGTHKYDATGTVQTSGGAGLPGITVQAFPGGLDADPASVITVTTGADGVYHLTGSAGLVLGDYVLQLTDADGADPQYDQSWYGGGVAPGSTITVAQDGIHVAGASTPLSGHDLGVTTMAPGTGPYNVTGTVSDVNGDPVGGATVTAVKQGGGTTTASSLADGTYSISLALGTYTISFSRTGFATTSYTGAGETPASVVVKAGGTVEVDTVAVPGRALGDTTMAGTHPYTLTGAVQRAGGTGLAGITVQAYPGDLSGTPVTTTTDGTGAYSLTDLVLGDYVLQFTDGDGVAPQYDQTWYQGTTAPGTTITVAQDGIHVGASPTPLAGHDLGVTTMSVGTGPYTVTGTVTDANGDPIAGATVAATKQATGTSASTQTDAEGAFALTLAVGSYKLKITKAGFAPTDYTGDGTAVAIVAVAAGGAVTVTTDGTTSPAPGRDLGATEMAGSTTYALSGTVTSSAAVPLVGITVKAMVTGTTTVAGTATTAAGGAFTLRLPVNTYQVQLSGTATDGSSYPVTYFGGSSNVEVKVASDGHYYVDDEPLASFGTVVLTATSSDTRYELAGAVYGPGDDLPALNGVTVTAVPIAGTAGDRGDRTTTGPDPDLGPDGGVYRLQVRPGKFRLTFAKAGYQSTFLPDVDDPTRPVTVTVSAVGEITAPGYDFSGSVVDDVQMLFPPAAFAVKPKLTGKAVVGQVLTTSFGTLKGAAIDKDYVTVEWFINGQPADDYSEGDHSERFRVPAVAATKKVSYRITIDDPTGSRGSTVFSSAAVSVPKAPATVTASAKKGVLTVKVAVPSLPAPLGTVTVKEGKKTVATVKLTPKAKGTVTLGLTSLKLRKGKHTLTLTYSGTSTVAGATGVAKIKV